MFDLIDIQNRVQSGVPVTEAEYAFLLRNNPRAMLGFLVSNNPGAANDILRHQLGYTELGFSPNLKTISRILDIMVENKNTKEMEYFLKNFPIDTGKVSPELMNELSGLFDNPIYEYHAPAGAKLADSLSSAGTAIGGFLDPIFGSTTTTTTTTAPDPSAGSNTSTMLVVGLVLVVIVGVAFYLYKRNK